MPAVIVASTNPVKIRAAENALQRIQPQAPFQVSGLKFPSPVASQPFGDEETRCGALLRAQKARQLAPHADYWMGIEGGVDRSLQEMYAYAWVVILDAKRQGQARSASFLLPHKISALVMDGIELGTADDMVFGRTNSKQMDGAVGILTGNAVDRQQLYEMPVILAFIPFFQPELYPLSDAKT